MIIRRQIRPLIALLACFGISCALLDDIAPKKPAPPGFIATPPSYYSTAKARYLGTKYKENLDRLAERIVRNSSTSQLQFANNVSSVGGIGFFTHSATKTADERYLEVVLATPETFETKGEYSEKVNQLFSRYGQELLGMLAGDSQIYQDKELSGYGLNFTWRNVLAELPTNRITLARAIIYFPKEKVSGFLRHEFGQNELLRDAVIFAVEEDGPLNLVSYQPRETKPDFRPAIREDNLASGTVEGRPSAAAPLTSGAAKEALPKNEPKGAAAKKDIAAAQDTKARSGATKSNFTVDKPEAKAPTVAQQKDAAPVARFVENVAAEKSSAVKRDPAAEKLALAKRSASAPLVTAVPEVKAAPIGAPTITPVPEPSLVVGKRPEDIEETNGAATPGASSTTNAASTAHSPTDSAAGRPEEIGASAAKPAPPAKKIETKPEAAKLTEKASPSVLVAKLSAEAKPKRIEEIQQQEAAIVPAPTIKVPASAPAIEHKPAVPTVAKLQSGPPAVEPANVPTASMPLESEKTAKASETSSAPARNLKLPDSAQPRADVVAPPAAKITSPRETQPLESAAKGLETNKSTVKDRAVAALPDATTQAPAPAPAAKATGAGVTPEAVQPPKAEKIDVPSVRPSSDDVLDATSAPQIEPPAPAAVKVQVKAPDAPAVRATTPENATARKNETPPPALAKLPEVKAAAAVGTSAEKSPETLQLRKGDTLAPAVAKIDTPPANTPPPKPIAAKAQEKSAEKPAPEQLALLRRPTESPVETKPLVRPAQKPLEGFIIQIAFNDKEKAQGWAEKMAQRGYAVSVTEAGAEGALRVRLGNFAVRDEAERLLQNFKHEGMSGIIINLPQAFRPEARSSLP